MLYFNQSRDNIEIIVNFINRTSSIAQPSEQRIRGLLRKGHYVHVVSTHETKINDKLAQNLTYDVSKYLKRFLNIN